MKKTGTEAGSTGRASTNVLRRLLGVAVVLMALCLVLAVPAAATGTPDTSWYDANETEFVLYTADELAGLAVLVNGGDSFEGKTVALGADIDLSRYPNWTPIGQRYTHPFNGVFNGMGFVMSNLSILSEDIEHSSGLFGYIGYEGYLCDCSLTDGNVISKSPMGIVGGLAGCVDGSVYNCSVDNFILCADKKGIDNTIYSPYYMGVIAGEISGSIDNCIVRDSFIISTAGINVGGITGRVLSESGEITNCLVINCTISESCESYDLNSIGGIAGTVFGGINRCAVIDCTINGMNNVGGIAGEVGYSSLSGYVENCCFINCTVGGLDNVGGIAGTVYSSVCDDGGYISSYINNCIVVSPNSITGVSPYVGGIAGRVYDGGIVNNCVSLIQLVNSESSEASRIAHPHARANLLNNYAWIGMDGSSVSLYPNHVSQSMVNGLSLSANSFWDNQSFFVETLGWDFGNTWEMNMGNDKYKLPVLKSIPFSVTTDVTYLLLPTINPSLNQSPVVGYDMSWYNNAENCFTLSTAEELAGFAKLVNSGNSFYGKTVYLGNDIDLSEYPEWIPIGAFSNTEFCGMFDGNGYCISNISISGLVDYDYTGLFGKVSSGVIINCSIINSTFSCADSSLGAFAGLMCDDGSLLNCTVSNCTFNGCNNIGGVLGYLNDGYISSCSIDDCVIRGIERVGGIMGYLEAGNIFRCTGSNSIVNGTEDVGGIVGSIDRGNVRYCSVIDTRVSGYADIGYADIGGIAGTGSGLISNCFVNNCSVSNTCSPIKTTKSGFGLKVKRKYGK